MANQIKKKYIQDAAIDGEKLELLEGQSVKLKKDGGEVLSLLELSQDGEDKILLKGEEAGLKSQVDAEQARAEGEESRIEGKVDQEVIDRVSSDAILQVNIDSEKSRAEGQEAAIRSEFASADESVKSELKGDVEVYDTMGKLEDAVNLEVQARETLEGEFDNYVATNNQSISDEVIRLEGLISDEETRAIAEEMRLEGLITDEEASRISDVTSLQNQINDILSNTDPAALDSLTEIVTAFQNADSDLSAAITSAIGQHQTELQEFKDEINPKVSTLESEMDAVEGRATTLESEMDAVEGEVDVLQGEMDAVEGRLDVIEGDSSVEGSIAKAQFDAQSYTDSEISSLQTSVSAEIDADVLVEKNRAEGEESRIEGKLDQEIQDRQDAVSQEETARINADSVIQTELDATQLGAGLEADGSFVDPAGFSSAVTGQNPTSLKSFIENVDTALGSVAADLGGQIGQEIIDRETLEGEFDQYVVDNNDRSTNIESNLSQHVSDIESGMGAFYDAMQLQYIFGDFFNKEYIDVSDNLSSAIGKLDSALAQEAFDRENADTTLQQNIDAEKARIDAILQASTADKDSFAEIVNLINTIDIENDNAFAGYVLSNDARVLAVEGEVDVLQGEMDAVEGRATTLEGEMDAVEGRLDTVEPKVTTLEGEMDTAQFDISTLQSGLSQEIQDRTDADNTLQSNIDAEESARISADNALDGRVQVLESVTWNRDIFVVSQTDVDNGYVDFSFEVVPGSVMGFVDRLGIHEGEDFTLSTEGGVTRMTFAGDLVDPGQTRLTAGDKLYMSYQYKV